MPSRLITATVDRHPPDRYSNYSLAQKALMNPVHSYIIVNIPEYCFSGVRQHFEQLDYTAPTTKCGFSRVHGANTRYNTWEWHAATSEKYRHDEEVPRAGSPRLVETIYELPLFRPVVSK